MKLEQLVALIVRFFIIYLFLSLFFQIGMVLISLISEYKGNINTTAVAYAGLLVAMLAILALLWKNALFVAKKIILTNSGGEIKTSLTFNELETLCFTVWDFGLLPIVWWSLLNTY